MLMPRYSEQDNHKDHGHASTTVAAHTKMRLLSKVEQNMRQQQQQQQQQQNQSISKIIHTAATGNGLVGDVDELLTPMRIKAHVSPPPSSLSSGGSVSLNSSNSSMDSGGGKDTSQSRPERNLWSRMEMLEMLKIMQQMNALELLNDRNVKSEQVFRQIEQVMRNKGYVKKSSIQIWTKWKFLKSTYNTTTRHGNGIPKVVHEEVYRVLARMLREHANANGSGSGISSECGNSMDSSNAELNKATTTNSDDDGKEDMGVEHPIFGFCLGLIKPEPMDNGYETPLKNVNAPEPETESVDFIQNEERNDQDTALDHIPFTVTVKNEPEMDLGMDGTNTPPPTAPTSPSPPPLLLAPGPLESTKTPTTLRVAAFANDTPRIATAKPTPTHGVLQIERPMPALSRNPLSGGPSKANRSMPLHSTSSINFVHPTSKLMLPRKQLPVRIPREISVQPARVSAMKMVPMRETGYSLRPDRMIPDLEQSISPPQSPSPPMPKYSMPSFASTSRQAQQLLSEQQQQQQPLRKRRLQFMQQTSTPVPVKLQRSVTQHETKPYPPEEQQSALADEYRLKLAAEETQRRKQQQEELFKTELTQLASAMHTAQTDMLADFFRQQKILARREHEFQLRQDNMVLSALRKQTDALLRTAKELLQTEANEPTETQQQQDEMEDRSSTMLLLQPEIELHETQDNREDEETAEPQDERADDDEEEEENDTQYSEDYNQSDTGMEMSMSMSAASEDASNHGAANLADDAQITC